MRTPLTLCAAAAALLSSLPAQAGNYGLTVDINGTITGRSCNNSGCQAAGTPVQVGTTISVDVWGAPGAVYVLGLGPLSRTCLTIPGIGNGLMLGQPADTISIGVLSAPVGVSLCFAQQQGASVPITIPASASGGVFRFQALTFSGAGAGATPVFTDAIDLTVL